MAAPSLHLKDHWQEQRLFLSRIIAAAIIVMLLSVVLVIRLVHLQIVDYERFSELSQGNRFRIEPLPPNRGLIYDRNGLVIAENRPNWELVAVGEQIDDLERTLHTLEELGLVETAGSARPSSAGPGRCGRSRGRWFAARVSPSAPATSITATARAWSTSRCRT